MCVSILENALFHVMNARKPLLHVVPSSDITVCILGIIRSQ